MLFKPQLEPKLSAAEKLPFLSLRALTLGTHVPVRMAFLPRAERCLHSTLGRLTLFGTGLGSGFLMQWKAETNKNVFITRTR